jgi:hypothetical protein
MHPNAPLGGARATTDGRDVPGRYQPLGTFPIHRFPNHFITTMPLKRVRKKSSKSTRIFARLDIASKRNKQLTIILYI